MKKYLLIAAAFCACFAVSALDIVQKGKACVRIVVNADAGKLEKMAADDLKNFLEQSTKAVFEVVTEDKAGKSSLGNIYLGNTKFAAKNGFPQNILKDEEWVLKTIGKDLIITGAKPIGTFYGVWALLNKLGIYTLGVKAYAVPPKKKIVIGKLNERKKPVFPGRMIYTDVPVSQSKALIPDSMKHEVNMHILRSGMNSHEGTKRCYPYYIGRYYLNPKAFGTLLSHSLCKYVDPVKYFKTHPEYFSMNEKGKRFAPPPPYIREGSLCMSNKEVWKVTLESLRKMVKEDRAGTTSDTWPLRYDITVLDNTPYICKCPECLKIVKEEGSEGGLFMRYINYVANEIGKEYPDIYIKISAYSSVRIPGKITKPAKNVMVSIPDRFTESDAFRPLTHPLNKHRLDALMEWTSISNTIAFSDYWNLGKGYFEPPRVEVLVDTIKPDLELVAKLKAKTIFIEARRDMVTPQPFFDLQVFLGTQLMMDLNYDVEKLINIFLRYYYGPRALPAMRSYLNEIREGVKTHPGRQTILSCRRWHYFKADFALRHYLALKKAAAQYPQGNIFRERIEQELLTLTWCSLLSRREFTPTFKKAGINMTDMILECRMYADRYIRFWGGTKLDFLYDIFNDRFAAVEDNLPKPEKFKDIPDEDIRIAGISVANPHPHLNVAIVKDPESITGKAMRSYGIDEFWHRAEPVQLKSKKMSPMLFGVSTTGGAQIQMSMKGKIPSDEKYHWYKLPHPLELQSRGWFWGQCWAIQFNMSSFYLLTDGVTANNLWDFWFSAKFTGPAYNKNSKQPNAVYVDMVVLTRPGEKRIKSDK